MTSAQTMRTQVRSRAGGPGEGARLLTSGFHEPNVLLPVCVQQQGPCSLGASPSCLPASLSAVDGHQCRPLLPAMSSRAPCPAEHPSAGLRDYEASLLRLLEKVTNGCVIEINETGEPLVVVIGGTCGVPRSRFKREPTQHRQQSCKLRSPALPAPCLPSSCPLPTSTAATPPTPGTSQAPACATSPAL